MLSKKGCNKGKRIRTGDEERSHGEKWPAEKVPTPDLERAQPHRSLFLWRGDLKNGKITTAL
jgi:hypothetical protein